MKENIRSFWDQQALTHKGSALATTPDLFSHELEKKEILKMLKDNETVFSIGCGNGLKDIDYCKSKNIQLKGIDFSQSMISDAKESLDLNLDLKDRLTFEWGDILELKEEMKYDKVITNRCLINLENTEQQMQAIDNIYNILKNNGQYLMMENTKEGLEKINAIRDIFNLTPIEERWHNYYIEEHAILPYLEDKFKNVEIINFNSTYFLISRTINALVTEHNKEIDYFSNINKYAAMLPALGDYSPLKLFVATK